MQSVLKRKINTLGLLFISFTAIFGSGWLIAPFYAAQIAGPKAIIAWIIGALMSAVIGLTMAEVITLFPKAGGLNTIIQMTHGKLIGVMANMLTLIVAIILPALEVRTIIQYLGSQSSLLMTPDQHITMIGYSFAALLFFLINCINIFGVKYTTYINNLSVIFKLIAPITICCLFLFALFKSNLLNNANLHPFFPMEWNDIFLAISTSGIIFSFNGFNQATIFAAEAKNPQKSIPIAILGSILFSAILYIFIQYVFLISLPQATISQGFHHLQFSGDSGPFVGLAVLLGLTSLLYLIYTDAILSPLGTAFTYSSGAPRILYAFAENNSCLPILSKLNYAGIPVYSVLISMILSFLAFIFLPSLKVMISVLVAAFVLNYTIAPVSLLTLRKTYFAKRTFKVPFPALLCFLSIFFSNLMVYFCGIVPLRNLLILIIISFIISVTFMKRSSRDLNSTILGSLWFVAQLAILTGLAYLSEFKILSFYQVLFFIAIMSGSALIFAVNKKVNLVQGGKMEDNLASSTLS